MLTPADVEQKTFSTALRGYDLDEVDDFLDEIVATIKALNQQLEEARAAPDGAPAVVTPAPAPEPEPELEPEPEGLPEPRAAAPLPEVDESAIGRALVAAQTAADRLLEEAQSEAGRIVDDARSEADSWSAERDAKRREAQTEMSALAARVASVRSELAVLAGEVSEKLDDMDTVIDGSMEATSADDGIDERDDHTGEGDGEASIDWNPDPGDETAETGETSSVDEATQGEDHLDDILNGVANDLQLGGEHERQPEDPDEDE